VDGREFVTATTGASALGTKSARGVQGFPARTSSKCWTSRRVGWVTTATLPYESKITVCGIPVTPNALAVALKGPSSASHPWIGPCLSGCFLNVIWQRFSYLGRHDPVPDVAAGFHSAFPGGRRVCGAFGEGGVARGLRLRVLPVAGRALPFPEPLLRRPSVSPMQTGHIADGQHDHAADAYADLALVWGCLPCVEPNPWAECGAARDTHNDRRLVGICPTRGAGLPVDAGRATRRSRDHRVASAAYPPRLWQSEGLAEWPSPRSLPAAPSGIPQRVHVPLQPTFLSVQCFPEPARNRSRHGVDDLWRSTVQGVAKILQGEKLQLGTNRISMVHSFTPPPNWPWPACLRWPC